MRSRSRSPSPGWLRAYEQAKKQKQHHGRLKEREDLQEALRSTALQYLERVEVTQEVSRQELLHRKAVQYVERVAEVREQQKAKAKAVKPTPAESGGGRRAPWQASASSQAEAKEQQQAKAKDAQLSASSAIMQESVDEWVHLKKSASSRPAPTEGGAGQRATAPWHSSASSSSQGQSSLAMVATTTSKSKPSARPLALTTPKGSVGRQMLREQHHHSQWS